MDGNSDLREKLIQEGRRALAAHGVQGVSLRSIAQNCGVSCAAPYKHFRDKEELLLAVANDFNEEWLSRQAEAVAGLPADDPAVQIRAICKAYLDFLCSNPAYCTLITQRDERDGKWQPNQLFDQSTLTKRLIVQYAKEHNLSEEEAYCCTYVIRAVLYGVATMNQLNDHQMTEPVRRWLFNVIDNQI